MNGQKSRSSLRWLILSICVFSLLAIMARIAQAQGTRTMTLSEAIETALDLNIELQRSSDQVASSEISVRQAGASFLPDLNASASASRSYSRDYDPVTDLAKGRESRSLNLGLSTRMTLFDGFGTIASLQSSRLQLSAARQSLQRVRQSVIFETFSRYLQVLMDQELLAGERENLGAQRQQLQRVEEFYRVGIRSRADFLQQQAEISQAELRVLRAEESLNIGKLQLLRTIGVEPTTNYQVEVIPVENLVAGMVGEAVDAPSVSVLQDRADVDAQALSVEAAKKEIASARSGYWPSMSLSAEVGSGYHYPSEYGGFSDQVLEINPNARIGLSLSIPIFDRAVTRHAVQRARIQLAGEQAILEDLSQSVSLEVQQALLDYSTALKELEAARAQREYARQALQVTAGRYDVGSAILAELSLARSQYVSANNEWIQANYSLLLHRVALDYYIGRLTESPISSF
jgi:outer membrane protein